MLLQIETPRFREIISPVPAMAKLGLSSKGTEIKVYWISEFIVSVSCIVEQLSGFIYIITKTPKNEIEISCRSFVSR